MRSPASPAEIARTLVAGHLPGLAHVPRWPVPLPIRYAADTAGQPLILAGYASAAAEALWRAGDGPDVPVAIAVSDVAPVPEAPCLGRAWVAGWARPLTGTAARDAALDFAAVHPTGDLLLLGQGFVLYRVEVAAVRLEPPTGEPAGDPVEIDPAGYAAAEPDPLHVIENALLSGLAHHHRGELAAMLHRLAPTAGTCGAIVTPVRIDRYGMLVDLTDPTADDRVAPRRIRVDFPAPLRDARQFVTLLRPDHPTARGPARYERR
ncbi:DUF2470 domain-containing protein [Rugosimonospora africana]|uniref:DUF2470 domain-containing protein n=1 Tax=Rugosimonospora africana TaxID=556532 RepID=A0A8J3VQS6_9ACTN|nr:DUF2470 domain-containing protein [Rugosimonospora africana]GIH15429.1 hypothetical protein Raf01_36010 [Rugosimonospora africana]